MTASCLHCELIQQVERAKRVFLSGRLLIQIRQIDLQTATQKRHPERQRHGKTSLFLVLRQ